MKLLLLLRESSSAAWCDSPRPLTLEACSYAHGRRVVQERGNLAIHPNPCPCPYLYLTSFIEGYPGCGRTRRAGSNHVDTYACVCRSPVVSYAPTAGGAVGHSHARIHADHLDATRSDRSGPSAASRNHASAHHNWCAGDRARGVGA